MVARWIRFRVSGFQPRALCVGHVTYFFHNHRGTRFAQTSLGRAFRNSNTTLASRFNGLKTQYTSPFLIAAFLT